MVSNISLSTFIKKQTNRFSLFEKPFFRLKVFENIAGQTVLAIITSIDQLLMLKVSFLKQLEKKCVGKGKNYLYGAHIKRLAPSLLSIKV